MQRHGRNRTLPFVLLLLLLGLALSVFSMVGATQSSALPNLPTLTRPITTRTFLNILRVTGKDPADAATGVATSTYVYATFSREVEAGSISSSSFYLTYHLPLPSPHDVKVSATTSYDSTHNRAILWPNTALLPGVVYTTHVTTDVTPASGVGLLAEITWSFTTQGAPQWTIRTPDDGDVNVPLEQAVSIGFDQAMDAATLKSSSFYLKKGSTMAPAVVTYSGATKTATLTPAADLLPNTDYEVTLTSAAEGANGLSVSGAPVVWSFTTADQPQWTVRALDDGDVGVPVDQMISIRFDQNMDEGTFASPSFYLRKQGSSTEVPADIAYNSGTKTATLAPDADLLPGTTYDVTLSQAVKNTDGVALAAAVVWSFTTAVEAPIVFPDVSMTYHYADAIYGLANLHIIGGYESGLFGPGDPVKRQQFAKMIMLTMVLPVSTADICPFGDVPASTTADPLYPDHYVAVCSAHSITVGTAPGFFSPGNPISRAQLITMVARAANLPAPPAGYDPGFANFSEVHYPWAAKAAYAGLLQNLEGLGADYDFWASATRGEVAQVLWNLKQYLEE